MQEQPLWRQGLAALQPMHVLHAELLYHVGLLSCETPVNAGLMAPQQLCSLHPQLPIFRKHLHDVKQSSAHDLACTLPDDVPCNLATTYMRRGEHQCYCYLCTNELDPQPSLSGIMTTRHLPAIVMICRMHHPKIIARANSRDIASCAHLLCA